MQATGLPPVGKRCENRQVILSKRRQDRHRPALDANVRRASIGEKPGWSCSYERSCLLSNTILLGQGHQITEIPRKDWEQNLSQISQHSETRLSFMSREHHLVRNFVVRELPRTSQPVQPELISQSLELPLARVNTLLDELEYNLFFLVRNSQGSVSWAYHVTIEKTPHELVFSTGERLYGA